MGVAERSNARLIRDRNHCFWLHSLVLVWRLLSKWSLEADLLLLDEKETSEATQSTLIHQVILQHHQACQVQSRLTLSAMLSHPQDRWWLWIKDLSWTRVIWTRVLMTLKVHTKLLYWAVQPIARAFLHQILISASLSSYLPDLLAVL